MPTTVGQLLRLEYGKPLADTDRVPDGAYPAYGANGEKARTHRFFHAKPSIIIGRKGSAGELNLTDGPFWPLDVTYFVEHDPEYTEIKFLYYLLYKLELKSFANGIKPGINRNDIYSLQVLIPNRSEQQRIVTILDEAFDAIATAKANAEQNLRNANEVFEAHLRLVINNGRHQWPEKKLGQVAEYFGRGKSRHRPRNDPSLYGGPYPFIQTGDVRNADHFITEYSQTYSSAGLAQSKLWPVGTLCITIAANIAETGVLAFDACFPDSVIGFVPDSKLAISEFVEYLLQSYKVELQALGKGSAQANINLATFEGETFPFPDVATQRAIADRLDEIKENVRSLESIYQNKVKALDELKNSLLHQAFTGQL
jgi:type I restriction enzyme S subunit